MRKARVLISIWGAEHGDRVCWECTFRIEFPDLRPKIADVSKQGRLMPGLRDWIYPSFFMISEFQGFDKAQPPWRRLIIFIDSLDSNANLFGKFFWGPRNNILPAIWALLSSVKVTYKFNYHALLLMQWNLAQKNHSKSRDYDFGDKTIFIPAWRTWYHSIRSPRCRPCWIEALYSSVWLSPLKRQRAILVFW